MPRPHWIQYFGLLALVLVSPGYASAQTTCDASPFLAVKSWTGTVTITGSGSGTINANGHTYTYNVRQQLQLAPVLTPSATDPRTYTGPENVSVKPNDWIDQYTDTPNGTPTVTTTITGSGFSAMGDTVGGALGASLGFSDSPGAGCGYAFGADFYFPLGTYTVSPGSSSQGPEPWGPGNIPNMLAPTLPVPQSLVPYPTSGTILSGTIQFDYPALDDPNGSLYASSTMVHWTITWSFAPTPRPLEIHVSIPGYATWRPSAGRTETDPGVDPATGVPDDLKINAQLYYQDTQQLAPFGLDHITFKLAEVSQVPGVVMNWPAKNALINPTPPDLSFKDLGGKLKDPVNPKFSFNADGTQADLSPDPSVNGVITIALLSYDWGGWATLNVTGTAAGQPVTGRLVNPTPPANSSGIDILLPERQPGSHIADNWKNGKVSLSTPDTDDSENDPLGDEQTGDGFSLYEEYRGFYMGCWQTSSRSPVVPEETSGSFCRHVEGDPQKKDLFVVNELGSALGIKKFANVTGLKVHYLGLTRFEIDTDRTINFNYLAGDSTHLINANNKTGQHALIIGWGDHSGTSVAVGGPGLPRMVSQVQITSTKKLLHPPPGPKPGDDYFTSTVAHELSHSVSVWHHGDFDIGLIYWYVDSKDQIWETSILDSNGLPIGGVPIKVFYELQNPATDPPPPLTAWEVRGLRIAKGCETQDNQCPPNPNGIEIWVGNVICSSQVTQSHLHSGDVNCVMRYDCAGAYVPLGYPGARYYLLSEEQTGYQLTSVAAGTDVNDAKTHKTGLGLLSRYGDADITRKRGDCSTQIDVNDLHDWTDRRGGKACPVP